MYQQYRLIDDRYKNIENSGRPDDVNEKILNGDYLDKSPTFNEEGEEIPFEIPSRDELMKDIFSDWKVGDKLYIGDVQLINPILDGEKLRDKTREEQILQDNKIELLFDGEYVENGKIIKVEAPLELYLAVWDRELLQWVESPNSQNLYYADIDKFKSEILEDGFIYNDIMKTIHQQKCRDKDRSFLESSINTMVEEDIQSLYWSFNNGDIKNMTIEELKELRKQGFLFNQMVFGVEAKLKAKSPYRLDVEEYKNLIDLESTVKCWR